ncbi:MAG: hypothetical protein QM731_10840 [Chitinophagaceae bacterium]
MKEIITHRFLPPGYNRQLCRPSGLSTEPEYVFTKHFDDFPAPVSMRPLYSDKDISIVEKWIGNVESNEENRPLLAAMQSFIAQSDCAQSFMMLVNGEPYCQADVVHAPQEEISIYLDVKDDDYVLQLLPESRLLKQPALNIAVLKSCLEYFSGFSEVGQLFVRTEPDNQLMQDLFVKAGFTFLCNADTGAEIVALYHFLVRKD